MSRVVSRIASQAPSRALSGALSRVLSWVFRVVMKQSIVPYIGELRLVAAEVVFVASPMSLMLMGITTYEVAIKSWASSHLPWLSLWVFLGMLMVPIVIMIVIGWKFILPSIFHLSSKQSYIHNSPTVKDIQEILKRVKRVEKVMGIKDDGL